MFTMCRQKTPCSLPMVDMHFEMHITRLEDRWKLPCARKHKKNKFGVERVMPATKRGRLAIAVLRAANQAQQQAELERAKQIENIDERRVAVRAWAVGQGYKDWLGLADNKTYQQWRDGVTNKFAKPTRARRARRRRPTGGLLAASASAASALLRRLQQGEPHAAGYPGQQRAAAGHNKAARCVRRRRARRAARRAPYPRPSVRGRA